MNNIVVKQYSLSIAAGKRLIAKSILNLPSLKRALVKHTVVIVAGTTNSYAAEEILGELGQQEGFRRECFYRGITLPPSYNTSDVQFLGDVVIVKGKWEKGLTIFDVVDDLTKDDIIIKGANAINMARREAAVLIGHNKAGTIGVAVQAVTGRRVELIIPVGLEKRITGDIGSIALKVNAPNASGPRYFPIKGNIITELEAVNLLSGVEAELIACGGVSGAEGNYQIAVTGTPEQLDKLDSIVESLINEPPFVL